MYLNKTPKLLAGMLCLALLAGCSREQASESTAAAKKTAQQSSQSKAPVDPFVKAVTVTVGESPVELRFELTQRPEPKQSLPINLRLTGLLDSKAVTLKLTGNEHLHIVSGQEWSLDALGAGQAQTHEVTVRADSTGVFVMNAEVQTTRDSYTKAMTFAIPVAVTDPAAVSSSASSSAASSVAAAK